MGDVVSDGTSFQCTLCTKQLKLNVLSSSCEGEGKKLATEGNFLFPPPAGAQCFLVPNAPAPCAPPNVSVTAAGQSDIEIDSQTALGAGCMLQCAKGGMLSVASSGQSSAMHGGAEKAMEVAAESNTASVLGGVAHGVVDYVVDTLQDIQSVLTYAGMGQQEDLSLEDQNAIIDSVHKSQEKVKADIDQAVMDTLSKGPDDEAYHSARSTTNKTILAVEIGAAAVTAGVGLVKGGKALYKMAKGAKSAVEAGAHEASALKNLSKTAANDPVYNFTKTAAKRMEEPGRRIPIQTMDDIIKHPIEKLPDPKRAANSPFPQAEMHYSKMHVNGKEYNVEVLYDQPSNTVLHFKYTPDPIGNLPKITR